jgi:hypothetical protein
VLLAAAAAGAVVEAGAALWHGVVTRALQNSILVLLDELLLVLMPVDEP